MLRTLVAFLVLAMLVGGGLGLVGLPIRTWLLDEPEGRTSPAPAVLVGLAVLQLATWYVVELGGGGAHNLGRVLLIVGLVGSILSARRLRRSLATEWRRSLVPAAAGLGAAVVFLFAFSSLFRVGFQTTASLGNNDAASYAVVARHLVERGLDEPGNVAGQHTGTIVRHDAFGSAALIGVAGDTTGLGSWKLTMPSLFVLVVLGAATLAKLLAELFPRHHVLVVLASAGAMAGVLPLYVMGQFFFGQLMAMAVAPVLALVALRAVNASTWRAQLRLAGAGATMLVVLMSHYSQFVVPIVAVLVPGVVLTGGRGQLRRSTVRVLTVLGGGMTIAVLLAPQWLGEAIRHTRRSADAVAGWPLPGFLPVELFGFTSTIMPKGDARVVWSVVLVAVIIGSVVTLRRHERGSRWVGAAVALILLSHLAVYLREGGPTYRQWKWITFYQPIFAAGALVVVAIAAEELLRRHARSISTGLCLLVGLVGFSNTRQQFGPVLAGDQPAAHADLGLSHLEDAPALDGLRALNVDVTPFWDTMWAAYFLSDIEVHLQSQSYYAMAVPIEAPTLVPRTDLIQGAPYVPVTARFMLEAPFLGPTSAQAVGLDAAIEIQSWSTTVTAGTPVTARVLVTNTGSAAWLPTGSAPGGVDLGVHLTTATGRVVSADYTRQTLVAGWHRPILPGATVTMDLAIEAPPPGSHVLEFQLVSEAVAWFGPVQSRTLMVT